jgi:hypothetical protein
MVHGEPSPVHADIPPPFAAAGGAGQQKRDGPTRMSCRRTTVGASIRTMLLISPLSMQNRELVLFR